MFSRKLCPLSEKPTSIVSKAQPKTCSFQGKTISTFSKFDQYGTPQASPHYFSAAAKILS